MAVAADPKQVVDELRSFCNGRDQTQSDAVKALGESYAALCREADERLSRCDELLHKGLREEALQLADREPVLLDVVARLHFPELSAWEEIAASYGYSAPPSLLLGSADALNRAYADREALKAVLREHRRFALSDADLLDRLAVLRKLAQLDPANPAWQDDLVAYEEARQRDLRTDVQAAFARRDDARAHTLVNELMGSSWRVPPTLEFLRPVVQDYLQVLARSLAQAHRGNSISMARKLLGEWDRIRLTAEVAPTLQLAQRVEAVRRMVDAEDRRNARALEFQAVLDALHRGLHYGATADGLRELYADAEAFGLPIPKDLDGFYRDRMDMLTRNRKNFEWIAIGMSFAIGAMVLVGFLIIVMFKRP